MSIALQYAVIALLVVLSAIHVWRTRFPASWRRMRVVLAIPLLREGRPVWMRSLGRWIAPASALASGECGGCNSCK